MKARLSPAIPGSMTHRSSQPCLRRLRGDDERANNSAYSWPLHVFAQPGVIRYGKVMSMQRLVMLYIVAIGVVKRGRRTLVRSSRVNFEMRKSKTRPWFGQSEECQ